MAMVSMSYAPTILTESLGVQHPLRCGLLVSIALRIFGVGAQLALLTVLLKWTLVGVCPGSRFPLERSCSSMFTCCYCRGRTPVHMLPGLHSRTTSKSYYWCRMDCMQSIVFSGGNKRMHRVGFRGAEMTEIDFSFSTSTPQREHALAHHRLHDLTNAALFPRPPGGCLPAKRLPQMAAVVPRATQRRRPRLLPRLQRVSRNRLTKITNFFALAGVS